MSSKSPARLLCSLFLLLAVIGFVIRGPMRLLDHSDDFAALYTSSRALLLGQNPYDHSVLPQVWKHAGGPVELAPSKKLTPAVYTPSTFVALWPVAILHWHAAQLAWFVINLLSIAALMDTLRRLMEVKWSNPRMLLLAGFAIGLRPVASAVSVGQMSIVVTELGTLGILLTAQSTGPMPGLFFGPAIALKAPLAAVFLLPDLMARRWKPIAVTLLMIAGLTAIGMLCLGSGSGWVPQWLDNVTTSTGPGGINDASPANPSRIQLINLQYPLSSLIPALWVARTITWLLAALFAAPALYALKSKPAGVAVLLPLACLCTVELSACYHRAYDAVLLAIPLAWAMLPATPRWQTLPVLALISIIILPGAGLPSQAQAHNWLWSCLLLPRDAWMLLLLTSWLTLCQVRAFGLSSAVNRPGIPKRKSESALSPPIPPFQKPAF